MTIIPKGNGLDIGEYTTDEIDYNLGDEWRVGENTVRLVKNGTSALSTPSNKIVLNVWSDGVRTNVVQTTTTAGSTYTAGVIPTMKDTSTIPASAYFLIYVDGPVDVLTNSTGTTDGTYLQTSTAAGAVASIAPASPTDMDKAPLRQHGDAVTAAGLTVKAELRKVI